MPDDMFTGPRSLATDQGVSLQVCTCKVCGAVVQERWRDIHRRFHIRAGYPDKQALRAPQLRR